MNPDDVYLDSVGKAGDNPDHYAYTPDLTHPSTWKLPLVDQSGKPTARQVGMAVAALGPAWFRGKRVQIPNEDLPAVRQKVLAAWKKVNPDAKDEDIPDVLRKTDQEVNMTVDELQAKQTELEASIGALTKRAEDAEFQLELAKLSPEDREAYNTFDEATQQTYRAATAEVRQDMLEKVRKVNKKQDDNAKVSEEIQKQLTDLQKQLNDSQARTLAAEEVAKRAIDAQHMVELSKRAEEEFSGLPGTPVEKASVLKSLEKLTKEEQDAVEAMLKAGNACLVASTKPIGKDASPQGGDAWTKISKMADQIVGETHVTHAQAVAQVIDQHPELYNEYLDRK